ncbi:MAG: methionyl-tRNA formyltransferase, partial [Proteobacteria bacterium]|nr:methionyl-tRNA formyltransferase [Pseudomonadota bacterium]
GEVVGASKNGIDIACGAGVLRILELQRAGGRVIAAADYLNARPGLRKP